MPLGCAQKRGRHAFTASSHTLHTATHRSMTLLSRSRLSWSTFCMSAACSSSARAPRRVRSASAPSCAATPHYSTKWLNRSNWFWQQPISSAKGLMQSRLSSQPIARVASNSTIDNFIAAQLDASAHSSRLEARHAVCTAHIALICAACVL